MGFNIVPPWIVLLLHALGLSAALQRVCVCSVRVTLRILPACAIILYLLSVSVYVRKPVGVEDSPKHPEVSPKRVTKRRLQVEHRFGAFWDHATDKLVLERVDRRKEREG